MVEKTTQKKVVQTILQDLESEDSKVILAALKRIKSKGDASVIPAMIAIYGSTNNELIQDEIKKLLSQLKVKEGVLPMIEGLLDGNDEVNEMILFSLWNANLNPINYMAEIVDASCKGSYMVALEGLTVIENMEGPFNEEVLNDTKLVLSEYFLNEDEKSDLIKSILGCIRNYDNFISA
jgi:hypothetical protein